MAISNIGPNWTLGDRLAKARREAGIQVQEMADVFDVTRNTIYTWEHDAVEIKLSAIRRWAEVTGTPLAWLLEDDWAGDGRGPHRAPAAGAAALPIPTHTADADEVNEKDARGWVPKKTPPSLFVTSTQVSDSESAENGSDDPCRNPRCAVHHVEPGDKAA